jgi:nitrous oxidase accessory protein NosD
LGQIESQIEGALPSPLRHSFAPRLLASQNRLNSSEQEFLMKTLKVICLAALFSLVTSLAAQAQTILVDADKVNCPTATFSAIQPAIDSASPGETVRVCKGVYHEQLILSKSISVLGDPGAELIPTAMTANATGATVADQIAAAIVVKNTTAAIVGGFYIDGSSNGILACAPRLIGILVQDASVTIRNNAVRHFRLGSTLPGCQSGNGIEVETTSGASSVVLLHSNSVDDYQKNGITANETGSNVTIQSNFVSGIGPTTGAAQNGIQVGFGATGMVDSNTVENNVWSPCVSVADCTATGTGILIFDSNNIRVLQNNVGTNQVGIFTNGANTVISGNSIFNSLVLDGVALASDRNKILSNEIVQSDEAGLDIQGNHNTVIANEFIGAEFGILIEPGSTGTLRTGNTFHATLTSVLDASATPPVAMMDDAAASLAAPKAANVPNAPKANIAQRVSPSR